MATRLEAQAALSRVILDKLRQEPHPSSTQMSILEHVIPEPLVDEYLDILLEKVASTNRPSIPLLRRIQYITEQL